MNNRRGLTLISLVITVIILLIITGITVVLTLDTNFLGLTKGTKHDLAESQIKEYGGAVKSSIVTDKDLNEDNVVSLFVDQVNEDNAKKQDFEKHKIETIDEVNKTVTLSKDDVLVVIDLNDLLSNDGTLDKTLDGLADRFLVSFKYKEKGQEVIKEFIIDKNKTLTQYFNESGDSIPEDKTWAPELDLNSPVSSNISYIEYIPKIGKVLANFDLVGGTLNGKNTVESIEYSSGDIVVNIGNPTKEHYTFNGWTPSLNTVIEEDTTYIAQWAPINYTFTFNLNGGNIGGSTTNRTTSGAYNTNSTTPGTPVRTHYTFTGWTPSVSSKYDGNKSFTAQWTPVNYTFTFNLNGGNIGGSTTNKMTSGAYNTNSATPGTPVRTHYTFTGWTPSVPSKYDGNKSFTAQWTPVNYTITYNLNGGSIGGSTANQTRSVPYNTMPPNLEPTRSGEYYFVGWTPDITLSTGNKTYTAVWSLPMELEFVKSTVGEQVLIPITVSNFVLISNNGSAYAQYTSNNPLLTNSVAAGTPFRVKVLGRASQVTYSSAQVSQRNQLRKLISWGELGSNRYNFASCVNLIGPIPSPTTNSFINTIYMTSVFENCKNLNGSIPTNLFSNAPNITGMSYAFRECESLTGSIPNNLFANSPKITSMYWTFRECKNLTGSIPANLFKNCTKITTMEYTFFNCNSLIGSIPETLFSDCTDLKSVWGTFYGCSGLTGTIPANLFTNNTKITTVLRTFDGCSGLTGSIPPNLLSNCPEITQADALFYKCSGLTGNIPASLFANCPDLTSVANVFSRCNGLIGSIPANLFSNNPDIKNANYVFEDCINLSGNIPTSLFSNNPNILEMMGTFRNCKSLTGSIPINLFNNYPNLTDISSVFSGCSSLTGSIPPNLFSNCPKITDMSAVFRDCKGLTGSIPENLFKNNVEVLTFGNMSWKARPGTALGDVGAGTFGVFENCSGLTGTIPENLFRYNVKAEGFSQVFNGCKGLTGTIPPNLFRYNPKANIFCRTFERCSGLTGSIPPNLFAYNPDVSNFYGVFNDCNKLTGTIPVAIFSKQTNVKRLNRAFQNCTGLTGTIPTNLFTNNPDVDQFNGIFEGCTGLTGTIPSNLFAKQLNVDDFRYVFKNCKFTGAAPNLWTRTNVLDGKECFSNCTNLSNYSSIPGTWK